MNCVSYNQVFIYQRGKSVQDWINEILLYSRKVSLNIVDESLRCIAKDWVDRVCKCCKFAVKGRDCMILEQTRSRTVVDKCKTFMVETSYICQLLSCYVFVQESVAP